MPLLPPPSLDFTQDDNNAKALYVAGLVLQANERMLGSVDQGRRNVNLYLGNHWTDVAPDYAAVRYVFNRIKTILLSHAAIQNGQRAKISLLPRQSGNRGACFIDNRVLAGLLPVIKAFPDLKTILSQIPPQCMALPPETPAPLRQDIYEQLQDAIEQGQNIVEQAKAARLPMPKVIPPELIVEVNDTTTAAALQILFDAKWDECNADYHVITDSFYNGIVGWGHMFYRWDAMAQRHLLHNCEFQQVFLDPTRPDITLSSTAVWDFYLSEEQGAAEFPEFAEIIANSPAFTVGRPQIPGGAQYTPADIYISTTFRQRMGCLRFAYIRNQPYPMTPEDAIKHGFIVEGMPYQAPAPMLPMQEDANAPSTEVVEESAGDSGGPGAGAAGGIGAVGGDSGGEGERDTNAGGPNNLAAQPGGGEASIDDDGEDHPPVMPAAVEGGTVNGTMGASPVTGVGGAGAGVGAPTTYLLVKDGKPTHEVKPWGMGWPTRRGIREIIIIGGDVVADREYRGANIPLTHNVNYPRMFGPLGQGTPEDLEYINMAINEMLSDLIHLVRNMAFGSTIVSNTLEKANPDVAKESYRRPGTVLTADAQVLGELKMHLQNIDPPAVSPDLWRFLNQLLDLIDKQGSMAAVLQGETNPGMSGALFGQANSAAQGPITFVAKRAETMLKYLANLMLGGIRQMDTETMVEAVPKYPVYVWDAFKTWWDRGLSLDISAEIATGGGAARQQKAANLIAAAKKPVAVSQTTLQEALDLDPDKENRNLREEAEMQAPMLQPAPIATPPAVQTPQ